MKRLLFLLIAALLLCLPAKAFAAVLPDELSDTVRQGIESAGAGDLAKSLPRETQGLLEEIDLQSPDIGALLTLSPKDFIRVVGGMLKSKLLEPVRTLGAIVGAVILCALVGALAQGETNKALSTMFSAVSTLAVVTAMAKPLGDCILAAAGTLRDCSNFMLGFIPAFCSIVTVSGAPVTATGYNLLLFAVCQLVSAFAAKILVPFMGVYMGLCVAGSVGEDIGVLPLAKGVRAVVTWSLTLVMTAYVGFLSMQTLVSTGADSAMLKTGKFLIGSFVPVVGGAISDALVAARGAIHLLKTTVGAFGIVALAFTFLPVLINILLWYFTAKAGAFVSETLALKKICGILSACADCLGTMLAILVSFMLLIIISIVLLLSFSSGV